MSVIFILIHDKKDDIKLCEGVSRHKEVKQPACKTINLAVLKVAFSRINNKLIHSIRKRLYHYRVKCMLEVETKKKVREAIMPKIKKSFSKNGQA